MISLIVYILKQLCRRGEVGDHLSVLNELILREGELLGCLIEVLEKNQQLDLETVEEQAQLVIQLLGLYQQNLISHVNNKCFLGEIWLFIGFKGRLNWGDESEVWSCIIFLCFFSFRLFLMRCVESDSLRRIQNVPFQREMDSSMENAFFGLKLFIIFMLKVFVIYCATLLSRARKKANVFRVIQNQIHVVIAFLQIFLLKIHRILVLETFFNRFFCYFLMQFQERRLKVFRECFFLHFNETILVIAIDFGKIIISPLIILFNIQIYQKLSVLDETI